MADLYTVFMSAGGLLTLAGIFLTWSLSREVEVNRLGKERISWCVLAGGFLTALGFAGLSIAIKSNVVALLVLLGPALIAYALSESGLVRATFTLLLQSFLLLPLVFLRRNAMMGVIELASTLSVLLLINAIAGYVGTPREYKALAGMSSWGIVLTVWLTSFETWRTAGSVVYLLSLTLWVYTLIRLHTVAAERFHNSAQKVL